MRLFHPKRAFRTFTKKCYSLFWYYLVPDSLCLKHEYKKEFGCKLDLKNPKKFTEKIQWLKLHDRKQIYHSLVDKYEAKQIVSKIVGNEYIIKTLGVWERFEDINFTLLPEKFVLKCTHDSASVTIVGDKDVHDTKELEKEYNDGFLKRDYYHFEHKQWAYKDIKPRIIAEEYIEDDQYDSLSDYKFYCFGGIAKCVYVTINRFSELSVSMYDLEWNKMPFEHIHPDRGEKIKKPKNLSLMKELAEKIAGFIDNPFVRVDFYEAKEKVYFGEVTFYPQGGMCYFKPEEWDYTFGNWVNLPITH